jgi:hypothetical protein
MGLGGSSPAAASRATQEEEEQLRRAIELSLHENQQQLGNQAAADGSICQPSGFHQRHVSLAALSNEEQPEAGQQQQARSPVLGLQASPGSAAYQLLAPAASPLQQAGQAQQDEQPGAAQHGGQEAGQGQTVPAGGAAPLPPSVGGDDAAAAQAADSPHTAAKHLHCEIIEDDTPLEEVPECSAPQYFAKGAAAQHAPAAGAKQLHAAYRLHAVVAHEGPAASCGHFTVDVRDPASSAWYRMNDSLASRISASEAKGGARQRQCYMLFYALDAASC